MSLTLSNFGPLTMVDLPGGWFVSGSSHFGSNPPRWESVPPLSITSGPVTEAEFVSIRRLSKEATDFLEEIGSHYELDLGHPLLPSNHPMTRISWFDHGRFNGLLSAALGRDLRRPSEVEWEYAIRGRPVDIRKQMELERVKPQKFEAWAKNRFENFVTRLEEGARIMSRPDDSELQEILRGKQDLWAWRVYGTLDGRLTGKQPDGSRGKNAWYGYPWDSEPGRRTRKVVLPWATLSHHFEREEFLNDQIEAGTLHSHGIIDGTGNVSIWCEENHSEYRGRKVHRGGSYKDSDPGDLWVARRHCEYASLRSVYIGMRCVAIPREISK